MGFSNMENSEQSTGYQAQGYRHRATGTGYQAQGSRHRVPGTGYQAQGIMHRVSAESQTETAGKNEFPK